MLSVQLLFYNSSMDRINAIEENPLIMCVNNILDLWWILWDKQNSDEGFSYRFIEVNHKPSIEEVKGIILNWYNQQIGNKILSGFVWRGNSVWLSMENQLNYKAAYDLAVQTEGRLLPTFKFGTTENPVYHTFKTLEELEDFYTSVMSYVTETLSKGWEDKDSIDWSAYEDILK